MCIPQFTSQPTNLFFNIKLKYRNFNSQTSTTNNHTNLRNYDINKFSIFFIQHSSYKTDVASFNINVDYMRLYVVITNPISIFL